MKFHIKRTSSWGDKKPVPNAVMGDALHVHCRTCSEQEFNEKFSNREGMWRSKGKNHRVNSDGHIERDEDASGWFIEINSLDGLLALSAKEGELVVCSEGHDVKDHPTIEIYDDYRE